MNLVLIVKYNGVSMKIKNPMKCHYDSEIQTVFKTINVIINTINFTTVKR